MDDTVLSRAMESGPLISLRKDELKAWFINMYLRKGRVDMGVTQQYQKAYEGMVTRTVHIINIGHYLDLEGWDLSSLPVEQNLRPNWCSIY